MNFRKILIIALLGSVPLVLALGGGDIIMRLARANDSDGAKKPAATQKGVKCKFPDWIGQPVDRQAVQQAAGERPFRIYGVNDMVTMDHVPKRLNVIVDKDGIVKRVKCG